MALIEIKDLSFSYPECKKESLKNINLSIEEGEFVILIGESGCGKSTLLRMIKSEISPYGNKIGEIYYDGVNVSDLDLRRGASEIGFVMQNIDYQIVTDKVWHELSFGLENLGVSNEKIRRKVAEMASYFGIQNLFRRDIKELSGGQKQLVNLAAIMAMGPKVLILDEPTSQLDPIASRDFLDTIEKINKDFGITIIITEHRLEEVLSMGDRVILMDKGEIIEEDSPKLIGNKIYALKHKMFKSLPPVIRLFKLYGDNGDNPLTIKEGRLWAKNKDFILNEENLLEKQGEKIISLKDIWFRYSKEGEDILRGVTLNVYKGELLCILGGNGTGKSTLLGVLSGDNKYYRGEYIINGKKLKKFKRENLNTLGVLPQDPQALFLKNTVRLDLEDISKDKDKVEEVLELLDLKRLENLHPYDLSGGEQQKLALGKILLLEPEIILFDEPTKGLDGAFKEIFRDIINKLKGRGITIIMVTHNVEFAAENGDRCALFFDGDIVSIDKGKEFFLGNNFYTTSLNKVMKGIKDKVVTLKDVII